jgi:hypothetical protein
MPELYGNPTKDQIRNELRKAKNALHTEQKEHHATRQTLKFMSARVEELEAKLQRIAAQTNSILAETNDPAPGAIIRRVRENEKKEHDRMWEEIQAEAQSRQ